MATVTDLIDRARLELNDRPRPFAFDWQGDGSTLLVQIPNKPLDLTQVKLTRIAAGQTTTLVAQQDYTLDDVDGTVTLTNPVPQNAVLHTTGQTFRYFDDNDWTTFVTTALEQHLHARQDGVTPDNIALLPAVEEYPVSLLAVVQALYVLVNEAAFDIDINTPEGVSIPRRQRYEQLSQELALRLDQYRQLSSMLNVGLNRIEMFDLRRISRMTNRYVPIYQPQEVWDTRAPFEVYPQIDTQGGRIEPTTNGMIINLTGYSQQAFSYTLTLNQDVTNYTVRASIRRYPAQLQPLVYMGVTVNDATTGNITVTVEQGLMYFVGMSKFWDVILIDADNNVQTVVQGTFDSIRQGLY